MTAVYPVLISQYDECFRLLDTCIQETRAARRDSESALRSCRPAVLVMVSELMDGTSSELVPGIPARARLDLNPRPSWCHRLAPWCGHFIHSRVCLQDTTPALPQAVEVQPAPPPGLGGRHPPQPRSGAVVLGAVVLRARCPMPCAPVADARRPLALPARPGDTRLVSERRAARRNARIRAPGQREGNLGPPGATRGPGRPQSVSRQAAAPPRAGQRERPGSAHRCEVQGAPSPRSQSVHPARGHTACPRHDGVQTTMLCHTKGTQS